MRSLGTAARRGRLTPPLLAALIVAAGSVFVALVDPRVPGRYPSCPFHALTGLDCPACGGLRTVHALAHGDIVAAADFNLLLVAALPVIVVSWLRWVRTTGTPRAGPVLRRRSWLIVMAVVVGFTVLRNLPVGAVLAA